MFDLRAKSPSEEEMARREARKAMLQRESDLRTPATGMWAMTVKEAARRAGVSQSTMYRWIAKGKIESRRDVSKAGGRCRLWIDPMQATFHRPFRCSDADLH